MSITAIFGFNWNRNDGQSTGPVLKALTSFAGFFHLELLALADYAVDFTYVRHIGYREVDARSGEARDTIQAQLSR
jgi:hypothetical protein